MNRKVIFIVLGVAVVVAATAVYANWFRRDNSLRGSGTVEARNIRVGSEVAGGLTKCSFAKVMPSSRARFW